MPRTMRRRASSKCSCRTTTRVQSRGRCVGSTINRILGKPSSWQVTVGRIWDIAVDIRPGSKTFWSLARHRARR